MPFAALDATSEALARRVLADVPADRPRRAADVDRLPAPLVPILHARLAAAVDAAAPMPTAWLDAEPVRQAAEAWREAAHAAVAFPADEWARAVREAATRALAHLVRPAETLAAVAFLDRPATLPVADALSRARVFGPYPYLPQIAARYAERKGLTTIDRAGLEELFLRIDRRMASTFGPADWATLLGPLLALVGPVGDPVGTAPTALLRPLFMTKGAGAVAVELEGVDAVSPADLRAILDRTLVPAGAPPAAPVPTPDRPAASEDETAADLPAPADDDVRPPKIGSKYLAPEYDDDDASAVLGPPRPAVARDAGNRETPADEHRPQDGPAEEAETDDGPAGGGPAPDDDAADDAADDALGLAAPPDDTLDPTARPGDADGEPGDEDRDAPEVAEPAHDGGAAPPFGLPVDPPPVLGPPEPEADEEPTEPPAPTDWRPLDAFGGGPTLGSAPADDDPAEDAPPEDEPIWRRLARAEGAGPTPAAATDDEEPLWKRFAQSDLAARLPVPPQAPDTDAPLSPDLDAPLSPDLDPLEARVLGPDARERRDWFVEELFDGSPGAYRDTLGRIDHAATYTEATGIVSSDVFRAHRVNPYTESAVAFVDAIQAQFGAR